MQARTDSKSEPTKKTRQTAEASHAENLQRYVLLQRQISHFKARLAEYDAMHARRSKAIKNAIDHMQRELTELHEKVSAELV